jgi:hypothetical protein
MSNPEATRVKPICVIIIIGVIKATFSYYITKVRGLEEQAKGCGKISAFKSPSGNVIKLRES